MNPEPKKDMRIRTLIIMENLKHCLQRSAFHIWKMTLLMAKIKNCWADKMSYILSQFMFSIWKMKVCMVKIEDYWADKMSNSLSNQMTFKSLLQCFQIWAKPVTACTSHYL